MRYSLPLYILLCFTPLLAAQTAPETALLWPDGAPGAVGNADEDKPALTLYPATGAGKVPTGVIVCPGGSYTALSSVKEGSNVALWLNRLGISAFVLRYRLGPKYHHPVELSDAQRAVRYVRSRAADFGIQPDPGSASGAFPPEGIWLPQPALISTKVNRRRRTR